MIKRLMCWLFGHPKAVNIHVELQYGSDGRSIGGVAHEDCPRCKVRHRQDSPRGKLLLRIREGQIIPNGYGIAWTEWACYEAVLMPLPINVIAGAVRWAYFRMRAPKFSIRDPRAAYCQGLRDGIEQAGEREQ